MNRCSEILDVNVLFKGFGTDLNFDSLDSLIEYYIINYINEEVRFRVSMCTTNLTVWHLHICAEIGDGASHYEHTYKCINSNGSKLGANKYLDYKEINDYINYKANIIRRNLNIDKLLDI